MREQLVMSHRDWPSTARRMLVKVALLLNSRLRARMLIGVG
jgi:hypothetical protein